MVLLKYGIDSTNSAFYICAASCSCGATTLNGVRVE